MTLKEIFNEKITNVTCIHHGDADGISAAIVVARYIREKQPQIESMHCIKCVDYTKTFDFEDTELFNKNTAVCIVDYSLRFSDMDKLYEKVGAILWFDHHKSAIQNIWHPTVTDAPEDPAKIYMLIQPTDLCGAELTWLGLYKGYHMSLSLVDWHFSTMQFLLEDDDILYGYTSDRILKAPADMPVWLRYTGDWDIYRNPSDEVFKYKMYFDTYVNIDENGEITNDPFDKTEEDIQNDITFMEPAYIFYMNQLRSFIENYGSRCRISRYHEIDAFMVSIPNSIGSRVFASVRDDYEVGVIEHYDGKKFTVSLYRLNKNPEKFIDCSEIARTYKGGGHASAAGFSTGWEVIKPITLDE